MSIDVAFMSLFLRKDVVEDRFPGGVSGFRERFPDQAEDDHLFRICSMEGSMFSRHLDAFREAGLDPERDAAMAEMMRGPEWDADGIRFVARENWETAFPNWVAMAAEEFDAEARREEERRDNPPVFRERARPKLEVVRDEPAPAAERPEEAEHDADSSAPPRGVRSITLYYRRTATDSSRETVDLDESGELVISGYDCGETPAQFWGREDYEYSRAIAAEDVHRVLLGLIRERFNSDAEINAWLKANGIESDFSSW